MEYDNMVITNKCDDAFGHNMEIIDRITAINSLQIKKQSETCLIVADLHTQNGPKKKIKIKII